MIPKNFVSRFAITSRRKIVASAVIYGLSLAVRFTSAAGEEVEIPTPRAHPVISIMARNDARLPYQDWGTKSAQPIVFRRGWPPGPAALGCTPP
jgi:bifunctional pyridoxal-dependent enzyme with beta-cystathionase and maltose regulon repressor activities